MQNRLLGRWLVWLRRGWRDILFRALAVLTLTLIAICVSWNDPGSGKKYHSKEWYEKYGSRAEQQLVSATIWLDIFTGVLAVSTIGLWFVTLGGLRRQARDTHRSLRIATDALKATRAEFISSHRPRLIVREAYPSLPLIPGEWFTTVVVVANIGETAATIVESTVGFDLVTSDRLVQAPRSSGTNQFDSRLIGAGQIYELSVTSTERKVEAAVTENYSRRKYGFFLAGHVKYADDAGILRQMAFWRRYDPCAQRFVKTDKPGDEFEYSD